MTPARLSKISSKSSSPSSTDRRSKRSLRAAKTAATAKEKDKDEEGPPSIAVWNWRDAEVMPKQKLSAKNNLQKNMLAAWHVERNSFILLGKDLDARVTLLKHQTLAAAANWSAYAMERSIGRSAANISLVDIATGNSQTPARINVAVN